MSEFIERESNSMGSISGQKPVQNPNEKKKSRTAQVSSQNNTCFVIVQSDELRIDLIKKLDVSRTMSYNFVRLYSLGYPVVEHL